MNVKRVLRMFSGKTNVRDKVHICIRHMASYIAEKTKHSMSSIGVYLVYLISVLFLYGCWIYFVQAFSNLYVENDSSGIQLRIATQDARFIGDYMNLVILVLDVCW